MDTDIAIGGCNLVGGRRPRQARPVIYRRFSQAGPRIGSSTASSRTPTNPRSVMA